jgi:hypothetical protein
VDYYVSSASKLMSARVSDEQNKASYYAAMKSYFDAVMKTGDYASEKLSSTKPVQVNYAPTPILLLLSAWSLDVAIPLQFSDQ